MAHTHDILEEQNNNLEKLKDSMPEQMDGFFKFLGAVEKDGALDSKTKELIALALAVKGQCHWCIAYHVNGCKEKGATKEEMLEAGMVAVLMGGGPALMYMKELQSAIEDLS